MRKVDYRLINPQPLQNSRAIEARRIVADFLDQPEEMRLSRRAPIDEAVYTSEEVREGLDTLFRSRCGFCETSLNALHVEHYRPIGNASGGRVKLPHHYAWLAYTWDNLLLACEPCSRRRGNRFGLMAGRRAPLKTPLGQIRQLETPQLLDPGFDAPFKHLDFTLDGQIHGRTRRGEATIFSLDLNRSELIDERKNAFGLLSSQLRYGDKEDAVAVLRLVDEPRASFSGAQQILRYRFLSALAAKVAPFRFDDAAELIESLIETSSPTDIAAALDTLQSPQLATRVPKAIRPPRQFTSPMTRIIIENFKSIDRVEFGMRPSRFNSKSASSLMLLGENATGKTTVLQAVTLALVGATSANAIANANQFVPNVARGGHPGAHGTPRVVIEFAEGAAIELGINGGRFVGPEEPRANVIAYSSNRYFKPGKRRSKGGGRGLLDPTWGLPNPEAWLKDLGTEQFQDVARALAEIMALPHGAYIKRDPSLGTVVVDGDFITPISEHSDGYRSIFATAVDMLNGLRGGSDLLDVEGIVLIDEIETHLHPRWKMRLMEAMRKALPRIQFIATTHDPLCLRGMGQGEVQVMARDEEGHIVLLPDLPNVEGMRIDQILTSEHFGLRSTLDPSLEKIFAEYYTLLRQKSSEAGSLERIEDLRAQINEKQEIGETERERRLLAAIDRHLANQANDGAIRAQQERALDAELDAIWAAAEATQQ